MTAPLTPPPHHQPAPDPGQPGGTSPLIPGALPLAPYPNPYGEEDGTGMKKGVLQAVVTAVAVAVSGVLLGVLWVWLAPRVPLLVDKNTVTLVYIKESEGEQIAGVDGTFTLLALGFGVLSALVVFLVRRHGGIPFVVGLAAGALLGAVVAWRLGVWLGPEQDVVAHARQVGKGATFDAPLELKAKGALLAWPVAAMLGHLGLMALFGPRDPEPEGWAKVGPEQPGASDPYLPKG